jgi:superfamily I DNA/RNA helicase
VWHLKAGVNGLIRNKDLQCFNSYKEFCHKAETEEITDYLRMIKLSDLFGDRKDLFKLLSESSVDDEGLADTTITTAHKSKGMDWDIVLINDDFPSIIEPRNKDDKDSYHAELNLWYVTITRAKKHLVYGDSSLTDFFDELGWGVLKQNC